MARLSVIAADVLDGRQLFARGAQRNGVRSNFGRFRLPSHPRTEGFALEVRISGKWGSNQGKCRPRGNRPFAKGVEFGTKTPKSGGPERIGLRRAIFRRLRVRPVNRSAPKTPENLPLSAAVSAAESTARMGTGGGGATGYRRSPGRSLGELAGHDERKFGQPRQPSATDMACAVCRTLRSRAKAALRWAGHASPRSKRPWTSDSSRSSGDPLAKVASLIRQGSRHCTITRA